MYRRVGNNSINFLEIWFSIGKCNSHSSKRKFPSTPRALNEILLAFIISTYTPLEYNKSYLYFASRSLKSSTSPVYLRVKESLLILNM